LPRNDARVSGFEFSQAVAPASSGMSPSIFGASPETLADIIAPAPDIAWFCAGGSCGSSDSGTSARRGCEATVTGFALYN